MATRMFGSSVARLEDPTLLTGTARFVDDITLPGMAEAAFVRSPHGHAAIRGIDKTAALDRPGIHAVLTLDDLMPYFVTERLVNPPSPAYKQERDRPALAANEVVHVGEPVAIVIADDRYIAEDAAALVEVDYDPLPAVSDCRAALADGAPTVHKDAPGNLLAEFALECGDVDGAFAKAAHVFKESMWLHRGGGHSIECRGAIANHDVIEDKLSLWCSTQMPHMAMRLFCHMLGRDQDHFRVMTPDIGGGFGPKLVVYPEYVVIALAAQILGRPVKWIEDRREHFVATTQERDQYWEVEIAVDEEAHILGVRGEMIHDHGAYTARGLNLPQVAAYSLTLPYEISTSRISVRVALTNKIPATPVRGAGQPQGIFVMERLIDRVARELDLDRADVRRRNLVAAEKLPYTKPLKFHGRAILLDSGDYLKCQDDALERGGWTEFRARQQAAREDGRYIGIGMANYVKGTGLGPFEAVTVRIGTSGKVHVYSGAVAMGQGTETMLAQLVANELGGDMANIAVTTGDTAAIALGGGAAASRQAVTAGSSAHLAARKVREKALEVASHMLESSAEDLEIVGDEVRVKGVPDMKVKLGRIANAVAGSVGAPLPAGGQPGLEATEHFVIENLAYSNGTTVVELEVDIETGQVRLLNYILGHDSGRIIHPTIVDGQIAGGTAHGIGNTLFEWMGYDENAQPITTNYSEYLMVTATEMPPLEFIHHESPTPLNPLGIKGVGECGVVSAPAAIASAIEDALTPFGVHIAQMPIRPAEIVALIAAGR